MILSLLLACAPGDAPSDDDVLTPSAYSPDGAQLAATPSLSPGELEDGLRELVTTLPQVKPRQLHDTWQRLMGDYSDASCPEIIDHNGQDHWREDLCVSERGGEFRGWSLFYRRLPENPPPADQPPTGENLLEVAWLSGQARITQPDGARLDSFGDALHEYFADQEGSTGNRGFVFGDFLFTGPEAEGSWLQSGVTLESYYSFERRGSFYQTNLDTWVAGLSSPTPAIILSSFLLTDDPQRCGLEPSGDVRVRDDDGVWYDLLFDGPDAQGEACDGCGEAWRGDALVGEVCLDWSPLLFIWGAEP